MTHRCLELQRRAGGDAGAGAAARAGRTARLARQRHVGDGDEPSRQPTSWRSSPRPKPTCARCSRIPPNYSVLFLQGGALRSTPQCRSTCCAADGVADYVDTGHWAQKSIAEAHKYGRVQRRCLERRTRTTPMFRRNRRGNCRNDASYVHVTTNETIGGVEYFRFPTRGDVPLVADASSHILSRPFDVAQFGVIYAGAQKNIGPAGLTVVIVRDDLHGPRATRMPERASTMRCRRRPTRCSTRRRRSRSTSPG